MHKQMENLSMEQMREIVSKAPSNAESYQGGYYFRESPQFMFHNGFHDQWNLTDNDGLYFRAAGFHPVRIDDLRTAIAEHDSKIKCWSCDKYMTKSQRSANDGFCIHCSNEVDLGCNHNFEDVTIYGDSYKTYQCTICEFRDEEAERHG